MLFRSTVFGQLDVELPFITKILIAVGTFLGNYGLIVLPAFIIFLGVIVFFIFFFSKTKFIGQSILFATPGIQRLIREIELARFGYLLGTLLDAGISITEALDSVEKSTTFPNYKKLYVHLKNSLADGNSFQKSFDLYKKSRKLIPLPIQQLILAGEKSGNLSNTLRTISINFDAKTEQTTKNIAVILEPILLVIVWLGVVAVALAVILPIYSLIGGLNTDPSKEMSQNQGEIVVPVDQDFGNIETASTTDEIIIKTKPMLTILETGLGYLNVRAEPSTNSNIVTQVTPGESFEYIGDEEIGRAHV